MESSQTEFIETAKEPSKFKKWFDEKFLPTITKAGNSTYIAGIRDAFGTMIPLIIAGSIGILISTIIFGGSGSGYVSLLGLICKAANPSVSWDGINAMLFDSNNTWGAVSSICSRTFSVMSTATIGAMSLYFCFLYGYYIAVGKKFKSPIIAGFVSLATFIIISMGQISFFMDAKGLISGIIFSIISTKLFIWFGSMRKLQINLPGSVPPAVGKSFSVFLPATITLAIMAVANVVVLAPAIASTGWTVTSMTYGSLTSSQISQLFGTTYLTEWNVYSVAVWNTFVGTPYESLVQTMAGYLEANDQAAFVNWYSLLTVPEQAVVTNAMASLCNFEFGGFNLDFTNLDGNALIKFVQDDTGAILSMSMKWEVNMIDSVFFGLGAAIYQFFTSWFIGFATGSGSLGLALMFSFFVTFFWFFGIQGSNLMAGIFEPIWWMILGINTALVTSMGYADAVMTGEMGVFTKPFFDSYMMLGGSGATLGLLIGTFAVSKRRELKEVAKYATPAGIFQINEPTIFGYPLVLNPVYVIPFILTPLINITIGWLFSPAVLDVVNYSYIAIPWTAPWIFGAVITSMDFMALIPATLCLCVSILMYLPFIYLDNRLYFKKLKKNDIEKYNEETKYWTDKRYKFQVDSTNKYNKKIENAEYLIVDAENKNAQIDESNLKQVKKDKLKQKNLDKAKIKSQKDLKLAEQYKMKQDQKFKEFDAKLTKKETVKKIKNSNKVAKHIDDQKN